MDWYLVRRAIRRIRGKVATEDYDNVVCGALKRMARNQSRNRERAVRIITICNHYREGYAYAVAESRRLEGEMTVKKRKGRPRRPLDVILQKKTEADVLADRLRLQALECERMIDSVKRMIRQEEADFRVATARALAAKSLIRAEACLEALRRMT